MTDQIKTCKRDGFPMIEIDGQQQCLAEYMDRCLGGVRVTDVILRDEIVFYVFKNGHELPLLCYCCGEPLACSDLLAERENICGRHLESMSWDVEQFEDGQEAIDFHLEFSSRSRDSIQVVQISTQSAQKLFHPVSCLTRQLPTLETPPPPAVMARRSRKRHKHR